MQFTRKTIGYIIPTIKDDLYCLEAKGCVYSAVIKTNNVRILTASLSQEKLQPTL